MPKDIKRPRDWMRLGQDLQDVNLCHQQHRLPGAGGRVPGGPELAQPGAKDMAVSQNWTYVKNYILLDGT